MSIGARRKAPPNIIVGPRAGLFRGNREREGEEREGRGRGGKTRVSSRPLPRRPASLAFSLEEVLLARRSTTRLPGGLALGILFTGGLHAGSLLEPAPAAPLAALAAATAIHAALSRRAGCATAFFALGLLRATAGPAQPRPEPVPPGASEPVTVEGIVHEPPIEVLRDARGSRETRTLITLRLAGGEDLRVECAGAVRGVRGGRLVSVTGTLSASAGARNPGDRSDRGRLFLEVPHGRAVVVPADRIELTFTGITGALRGWIHETISGAQPESTRGFVLSMILGDRRLLPPEIREALLMTGTFHLLAISGLHVVLIMAFILRVPVPRRAALPFRFGVLALFSGLTGASPPVLRAALMFAIEALIELSGRRPRPLDTLGWTALLLLAFDPALLGDVGFQLSFVSVASILAWSSRLASREPRVPPPPGPLPRGRMARVRALLVRAYAPGLARALGASLALSAGTSAGTAPLTLLHFQRIHPLGPLWNVLGYPLTVIPVAGGFLTLLLAAIHPAAARPVAWAVDRVSVALLQPLVLGAEIPGSSVFLPPPPAAAAALAYGVLCGALVPAFRRRAIILGTAALALLSGAALLDPGTPRVWFFDAGGGDAALVSCPGSGAILVDGGSRGTGDGLRRAILATGHRSLEGAFLTHAHADHLRGLESVIGRLPLGRVWLPPLFRATPAGRDWTGRIGAAGIGIEEIARGRTVAVGASLVIEALHPARGETLPLSQSANDASLALKVRLSGLRLLLLGDIEEDGAASLLASGVDLETDVLLAPHHGRSNALWPLLLERARPRTLVFSGSGDGGAREEAARLRSLGSIRILATWEGGAVRISAGRGGDHQAEHVLGGRSGGP